MEHGYMELGTHPNIASKYVALTNPIKTIVSEYEGELYVTLCNFSDVAFSAPAYTPIARLTWRATLSYGGFGILGEDEDDFCWEGVGMVVHKNGSIKAHVSKPEQVVFDRTPPTVGALKYDNSKVDLSLLPIAALEAEALSLMYGERKYGRDNWRRGMESHRLVAAALRHIHAYNEGEDNDPESGVSHLGHARACLGMLLGTIAAGTVKDTRPALPRKEDKT
jgi:hypothetical protein